MGKLSALSLTKGFGIIRRLGATSPVRLAANMGVLSGGGYTAWKYIGEPAIKELEENDGIVGTAGKVIMGRERAEKVSQITDKVVDKVDNAVNNNGDVSNSGNPSQSVMEQSVGNTVSSMLGSGTNMFSGFFNNIFSGNINMMSVLALILGGWLLLGRHGLWAKIAGGILAMLTISSNSQRQQPQQQQQLNISSAQPSQGIHR